MSPDHDRLRADARRNRDALLATARERFDRDGPDVALDAIARAAGVANATLYRHFPTRADLLAAVYDEEVAALAALAERLATREGAGDALAEWLEAFVDHVAEKGPLASAIPDAPGGARGARFDEWHATMRRCAHDLLARAQARGDVGPDVAGGDLLALAAGVALSGARGPQRRRLLELARTGWAAAVR